MKRSRKLAIREWERTHPLHGPWLSITQEIERLFHVAYVNGAFDGLVPEEA